MGFWLRNIAFLIILIALGYYLIANEAELFPNQSGSSAPEPEQVTKKDEPDTKIPGSATKKNTNAAAKGLSRFYANIHGEKDGDGPRVRNNIVYLSEPRGDLIKYLEERRLITRPLRKTWQGSKDNRPFRKGETLHQKLVEYAKKDGLEVLWWLNRDFIVKDSFRINKDIIDTAYRVGKAVEGHFQDGLSVFFCYQQRSLVLTDKHFDYLHEECLLLPIKKRKRN